ATRRRRRGLGREQAVGCPRGSRLRHSPLRVASLLRFKVGTEVSYGVHEQSEVLFHVLAQSIDKPLSAVTEGEDVLSQRPHRFRAVDSQAVDSGQHVGDGRFPAAGIGHVRSSDRSGRANFVSALDDEFADETHGFRSSAMRAIGQGRRSPVSTLWLPAVAPGRPGPCGAGRSSRDARGTVRARKSRISAAISAALSSSAKWPVCSAWYSASGWSVRICRTACSGKISSLAPVATSVGGRRTRRNCCMALKTGTWFRMSYSRSSMISSTPGRSISALSMTQLSGSIREGSWTPDRYWPRSPSRSR